MTSRIHQIHERYHDPEDPEALLFAGTMETFRELAINLGVCADCLDKFPDPLSPSGIASLSKFIRVSKPV